MTIKEENCFKGLACFMEFKCIQKKAKLSFSSYWNWNADIGTHMIN